MRNPQQTHDLKDLKNVTLLTLDVTNTAQIETAVKQTVSTGKIDVVFNNAGYGLMGPLESATDKQITNQIETNLSGVIRVIKAFTPHFRENGGGMFITTTSIGGRVAFPYAAVYHATKWALEGFSESLAFELAPFGIVVKTVAPGGIKSDFAGRSLDISSHEAYQASFNHMIGVATSGESVFHRSSSEDIAEVVYGAVTDGTDRLRYSAGPDSIRMYAERLAIGDEAFRKKIEGRLMP